MMWSKLRKQFKGFITPQLRNRLDVHCTSYHDAADDYGEAWITLDGEKIFGGGYYHWYMEPIPRELLTELDIDYGIHGDFYRPHIKSKEVEEIMNLGIHETSHITRNIGNYLNTPFEESLASNNPIYKAFALIDRRLGKRRFDAIQLTDCEHPLVTIFYELRKSCFESKE
jgi:hypothetical protein